MRVTRSMSKKLDPEEKEHTESAKRTKIKKVTSSPSSKTPKGENILQEVIRKCPHTSYAIDLAKFTGKMASRLKILAEVTKLSHEDRAYMTNLYKSLDICDANLSFKSLKVNDGDIVPWMILYQHLLFGSTDSMFPGDIAFYRDDAGEIDVQIEEADGVTWMKYDNDFDKVIEDVVTRRPKMFILHTLIQQSKNGWHKNLIIILNGKTVVRFEPFAGLKEAWNGKADLLYKEYFQKFGFEYEGQLFDRQKHRFQSIENKFTRCSWDLGGYCVLWSIFVSEILLKEASNHKTGIKKSSLENMILKHTSHPGMMDGFLES